MKDARKHAVAAIIVAAGRGTRAGGGLPKQWRDLAGRSVAARSVAAFVDHPRVDEVVVVVHPDDLDTNLWPRGAGVRAVAGGATRAESVLNGLEAVEESSTVVLIHDAARPLVPPAVIDRVLDALEDHPGAAPGVAVVDALWTGAGTVTGTMPRDNLWRAQTPQGFHTAAIIAAHRARTGDVADDVEVARAHGLDVAIVPGDEDNLKITRPEDFARAARLLGEQMDIRMGHGFDVHAFTAGDHVTLCGVAVPHDRGLKGHSDADVAMHALTDAIYGALAEGDIGRHFPPSEAEWKGADSRIFLEHAVQIAGEKGYRLQNADVTIICEAPKIGPHADAMRGQLAGIAGVEVSRIGVKATTSEKLGFTGRKEGIAAMATALLVAS